MGSDRRVSPQTAVDKLNQLLHRYPKAMDDLFARQCKDMIGKDLSPLAVVNEIFRKDKGPIGPITVELEVICSRCKRPAPDYYSGIGAKCRYEKCNGRLRASRVIRFKLSEK